MSHPTLLALVLLALLCPPQADAHRSLRQAATDFKLDTPDIVFGGALG